MTIKTKKHICIITGFISLFLMLCIVGGMEWGDIPIKTGFALSALCEVVGAFLLWKGGVVRIG